MNAGLEGLARELAGLTGTAERLLMLHVPDPHGRCRGCTAPGTGIPDARWPCALHFYATAAQQIRTGRAVSRPGSTRQTKDLRHPAARELTEV